MNEQNQQSQQNQQNERDLCETLMNETKGLCDLYMHGSVEASTPDVRSAFDAALKETLNMQKDIYDHMASKGWYTSQQAQGSQIDQTKQKFSSQMNQQ